MARLLEGLRTTIANRLLGISPPVGGETSEVRPTKSTLWDGEGDLPLGAYSTTWDYYDKNIHLLKSRKGKYDEYDEMDEESPECNAALNIIADNATRGDGDGESLVLKSTNPKVLTVLNAITDATNLRDGLWTLARDVAKYGERAEEIIIDSKFNITRLKPLPTETIIPMMDKWGRWETPAWTQINETGDVIASFEDWQMLYFANKKSRTDLTGTGMGYAARKPFKQLRMMEDAVVVARLTRAHNRLAYMVETGDMSPEDAQSHLNKVKATLRKRRTINPVTGKQDLTFNPLSVEEDIFVATNKESKADVKILQGDLTVGNLHDLEYFQQKLFTAWQVPKAYLAHDKDTKSRSVMTEQDIQFARSIRHQQAVITEQLKKMFDLGLMLKGIHPNTVSYEAHLPLISITDDLRLWQTEQLKTLTAQMFKQTFWPSDEWMLVHFLGYEQTEASELLKGQVKPDKFNGLWPAPKTGNVQDQTKAKEAVELLTQMPSDEFNHFMSQVENLRTLWDWEQVRQRQEAA